MDAECIHCGALFASFGQLPLCVTCTRAHLARAPRAARPKVSGAVDLRAAVRILDQCDESFLDRFGVSDTLALIAALKRSEWDILPDRWTEAEIRAALAGHGTGATSER